MFVKGNKVSVLDDAINGVVVKVNGTIVTIETEDGFDLNFNEKELILTEASNDFLNDIARTNFSSAAKEKEIPKARSFVKEKNQRKKNLFLKLIYILKN